MGYRRPLLSELNDVDASSQADRFALVWDAEAGFHRYTELNVAAIVGLQELLEEYSSSIGARVVANNPISGGTATKISFDEKGLVTGGTAATTADVDDSLNRRYVTDEQLELLLKTSGTNTGDQDLSGYSELGHGHAISDVANLGSTLNVKADLIDGVIPSSQLPALVKTDVTVVASQAAMLELTAQSGDIAIRIDLSKTFVHNGGTSGTIADWSEMISPTDAVTSVNGLIGNITLGYADVGAAAAVHSHTISDVSGLQTALDGKAAASHTHTISDITDLPVIAKSSTGNAIVQANATGTINDSFLPTYLAKINTANTWTADQTLNAAGSSSSSPRTIGITASAAGQYGRFAIAGEGNNLQSGNGVKTQINSYWGIEISGDRRSSSSAFVAGTDDVDVCLRVYSTRAGSRPIVIDGAAGQTAALTIWRNSAGTHLSAINNNGLFFAAPGSQATPSIAFLGDPTTGISNQLSNKTITFSTDGVQRAWINNNGLRVAVADAGADSVIRMQHSGGYTTKWENTGTGGGAWIWTVTNDLYSYGGRKLYLIDQVLAATTPILMIASGRFGFGLGMLNPKATIHGIGSTILGAATSAVADADMGNGQINPYVDEVAHTLKIKVKYSNGTIRTATIALVA